MSIANHFGEILFLPFFIFVTASFETAFQVDLLTFEQEIGDVLGTLHDDIVPVRDVFPLAGLLVFVTAACRQRKLGNRDSARCKFSLGILTEIPQQNDFIDAFRCHLILNCNTHRARRLLNRSRDRQGAFWPI